MSAPTGKNPVVGNMFAEFLGFETTINVKT